MTWRGGEASKARLLPSTTRRAAWYLTRRVNVNNARSAPSALSERVTQPGL